MSNTRSLKIKFKNNSELLLDARLDIPIDPPKAYAIFCHCFTCTKETITTSRISRALAKSGIACLRFDFTGLGNSEGDFADTNFTTMVADIISASHYLSKHYETPGFLLGHSMGGTAALAASLQLPDISSIVTVASPSKPNHVLHHFGKALALLERGEPASFDVAGTTYHLNPQFIHDVRSYDATTLFKEIKQSVLIFNVLHDELVPVTDAEEIDQWVSGESKVITLEEANHLLTDKKDSTFVSEEIIEWINRLVIS